MNKGYVKECFYSSSAIDNYKQQKKKENILKGKTKSDDNELIWNFNYELAKEYYLQVGDLLVPQKYVVDDTNLGFWIANQRKVYTKGTLSVEKINKLNEIDMVWNTLNVSWKNHYKLAKQYYKENGGLLIPENYEINGVKLGSWIREQRKDYKSGSLSKDRIKLLEAIGMVWYVYKYHSEGVDVALISEAKSITA